MTHVSLVLRQKRSQSQASRLPSISVQLQALVIRLTDWLPSVRRNRRHKPNRRRSGKSHLHQLSDHELRDIGLTRDQLGHRDPHWRPGSAFADGEYLHKALRDLQYDIVRRSKID